MAFETKQIRNVVLLGHGRSGKTSLAEAMLYISGGTDRLGKISDGNTVCDYDAEEIARGFSLSGAIAPIIWKDTKFNILDTPGYLDFVGETLQALRVADSAIIVMDARAGIEVGTELAWDYTNQYKMPRAFFINKFDDNEARFGKLLDSMHDKFGKMICPVTIPMVKGGEVVGAVDLIDLVAHVFDDKGRHSIQTIPEESREASEKYHGMLLEAVASTNEKLMEKYFEQETITHMEIVNAIHEGIIHGDIVPVFCGVATKLWGVWTLMDKISESFPRHTAKKHEILQNGEMIPINPEGEPAIFIYRTVSDPFVGKMSFFKVMNGSIKRDMTLINERTGETEKLSHIYTVKGKKQTETDELSCGDIGMIPKLINTDTNDTLTWNTKIAYRKITYPVPYFAKAVKPSGKGDEGKISAAIAKMLEEDLTYRFENNTETKQQIVYGLGDIHLAVLAAKLKGRFGVNVDFDDVKIAYREKITKNVDVEGKHKKQNGGSGQYGHVKMRFSPSDAEGLTFLVSVVGGTVPKNFYPAVEKGILDSMAVGAYGYPMTSLTADLYDGSYQAVDSDEISFKTAASLAYKKCLETARPILLEPIGEMSITIPDNLVGDIIGDLNRRRASIMGIEASDKKGYTLIKAVVSESEIRDYPIVFRAITQGRGNFGYGQTGYDAVPENVAEKIIQAGKQ